MIYLVGAHLALGTQHSPRTKHFALSTKHELFSCPFVMLCEQERLHNPAQPAGARKTLRLALARRATTFSSSRNFACRQGRHASNISLPHNREGAWIVALVSCGAMAGLVYRPGGTCCHNRYHPTRSAYLLVLRRLVEGGSNLSNLSNFSNLLF